ncbi:diaminobutyrate acetyltransferase [Salipiger bermudensis]|uniref:L-2,4-diaminobutyric acid acetyltransferase n=1 Tax=Salipiger bermudensis (strain DSM 26914 / JCM 13377 / KCTC 12554 / HTCC2601) TaxID=314265 RepID=Q0FI23_SALBH|nr:diaminobutyrate acetyltransferase [Salipiger bermudensis]EAU43831.1 L-2,4-diaminobutyric acid acetyltransferase [Salipiger bermudensis HTCC2601]MBN9674592.1 diaminobutyrate acetyltransferase [Salipiger bermudensis]MCA1284846.1 diaminobutyrate acetyltransferase [Salipiger bermudensis]
MPKDSFTSKQDDLLLRKPEATDGAAIWELVRACKPLDENSMYCNLVQAEHFRDTCVVAELDGDVVGWISGHMIPNKDAYFVWQVAVGPDARGLGLGRKMLTHLVEREECSDAKELKTTITEDNDASWGLFRSFARSIGGELTDEPHYEKEVHFDGHHDTEHLVTISLPEMEEELASAA